MFRSILLIAALAAGATESPEPAETSPPVAAAAMPATAEPPPAPLREIGHVRATTSFCSAFERHFNGAVRPMLENDARASFIGYTLGRIEPHFHSLGAELLLYDDRVHMLHDVGVVQRLIPSAQGELDALRATAAAATDDEAAKQTRELATSLQRALDKQRQIAIDVLSVAQALGVVMNGGDDTPKIGRLVSDPGPGVYDIHAATTPADARDVRSYLHWQDQLDRIGDAEGSAAAKADTLVEKCH